MNESDCNDTDEVETIRYTVKWTSFALASVGIWGNVVCIILMLLHKYRWGNRLNLFLFFAYFCDVNFLICSVIQCLRMDRPRFLPFIPCHHLVYLSHVMSFVSQWSLWVASTERYLALARPLRYQHGLIERSSIIVMAIFAFAFGSEAWILLFLASDKVNPAQCVYRSSAIDIDFWLPLLNCMDAILSYVLPGFMIFGCTIGVRRVLRRYTQPDGPKVSFRRLSLTALAKASRRKQPEAAGYMIVSTEKRRNQEKRERRIVSILLLIAVIDAILNVQNYVIRTAGTALVKLIGGCLTWDIIQSISHLLYYCQFLLNALYWFTLPYARGRTSLAPDSARCGSRILLLPKTAGEKNNTSISMTAVDASARDSNKPSFQSSSL